MVTANPQKLIIFLDVTLQYMMLLKKEMICKQPLAEDRELNFVQIREINFGIHALYQGWQAVAATLMYALAHSRLSEC